MPLMVHSPVVYGGPDEDRRAGKSGGAARNPVRGHSRRNALPGDVGGPRPSSGRSARRDQRGRDRDRRLRLSPAARNRHGRANGPRSGVLHGWTRANRSPEAPAWLDGCRKLRDDEVPRPRP